MEIKKLTKSQIVLIILFSGIIIATDIYFDIQVDSGLLFVAIIISTLWMPSSKYAMWAGIISTFIIGLDFMISEHLNFLALNHLNHSLVLSLFLVWTSAFLIMRYKSKEKEIVQKEHTLKAFFNASREGILISNKEGVIEMANNRALEIFGYKYDELIGKKIEILVPDRVKNIHKDFRKQYIINPHKRMLSNKFNFTGIRKNRDEIPIELTLNYYEKDDNIYVMVIIEDLTSLKSAEDQLKQAYAELKKSTIKIKRSNTELEHFAYVASHDLQEPLRMITSYSKLLKDGYHDKFDQNGREFLNFIIDGTERMKELINGLLDYSRLNTSEQGFEMVNMNNMIEQVLDNLSESIKDTGAEIEVHELPSMTGDRIQLIRLFQNLIQNAIKFRRDTQSPKITVETEERSDEWIFSVIDNGIGIREKHKKRIFMIFQRLHLDDEYMGTGMGLAICKKIVERHGGNIWVESKVGRGSSFKFSIPKKLNENSENIAA